MVADSSRRRHAPFQCWDLDEGTVNCHSECGFGQLVAADEKIPSDRRLVQCLESVGGRR